MKYTSISAILLLILLVSSTFTSSFFTEAHATTNLVTVTPSNNGMITTLKFSNNVGDISDISSVILQIGQGTNFKSFKTDSGWFGIKSSVNTLTFTSTNPIIAGQSANFIINRKVNTATSLPARIIETIVESQKLESISEHALQSVLSAVIANNPKAVGDYKKGKENAIMFLVGQAMKELKGKTKADEVKEKLIVLLKV